MSNNNQLTFQIGKKYVSREGTVVILDKVSYGEAGTQILNFISQSNIYYCSTFYNGRGFTDETMEHPKDIVAEYVEPIVKPFDPTKPVQTKNGLKVTILGTDGKGKYTIYGYAGENYDTIHSWTKEGYCSTPVKPFDPLNLVNIPQIKVVPIGPEDVKVGDLIKRESEKDEPTWEFVAGVKKSKSTTPIYYLVTSGGLCLNFKDNLRNFLISHDKGVTWEKCEKVVED